MALTRTAKKTAAVDKPKAEKVEKPKAEKAPKVAKPVVTVEKVVPTVKEKTTVESEHKVISERVSGKHRVKFLPNGVNAKLGLTLLRPAASTAQDMVDKGWGNIVE